MKDVFLGIDTSNYTTSVGIVTGSGELLANLKIPLSVKQGERGLRQSDALFAHTVNLPLIMEMARDYLSDCNILAVGVSSRPRNCEGSYMPCFLAGVSSAESIGTAACVPVYRFSHQCGHIMAAIASSEREDLIGSTFAAFHVSGGTTELLRVTPDGNAFTCEIIGGTADLNAGQVIDRIGVYMGLPFPAGSEMERLALLNEKPIPKKHISVKSCTASISGLENMAMKLYDETGDKALVAAFVLDFIGRTLDSVCRNYTELYGDTEFVFAGGVMCNSIIKKKLSENRRASFAIPAMSADNAVGIAHLTRREHITKDA